jgi:hypothetical protein
MIPNIRTESQPYLTVLLTFPTLVYLKKKKKKVYIYKE